MTPRDPVREALVSARTRAWLADVDAPMPATEDGAAWDAVRKLEAAYDAAESAVEEYDARTTPAASSDAGATPTEGNP